MVLIAYAQKPPVIAHVKVSFEARSLNLGLSCHLHPDFVYASSKGSGESAEFADSPEPLLLFNPYKPSILFMGHRQTLQNQIRCPRTWRLIRFSTVCSLKLLLKFQ